MTNRTVRGIEDALGQLEQGAITRRVFASRAAGLGLSTTAIGALLAACGSSSPTPSATNSASGAYNPKRYAGTTLTMLVVDEGEQKTLAAKQAEIESMFGINFQFTPLAAGPEGEKAQQAEAASTSPYDIVDTLGYDVAQAVGGGSMTRLNEYLANPALTPPDYDFADFPKKVLDFTGYFDVANQSFGGSDLYLLPGLEATTPILYYRKDLLDQAGLQPPTTWDDYLTAAATLTRKGVSGTAICAQSSDVSVFLVEWYTRFVGMGGTLMTGSPKEKNFTPHLDSGPAIAALQHMVDCVKYSPSGVLSFDFTAETDQFAAGKVAMFIMWSTIAGQLYNPNQSDVATKVQAAQSPGISPQTRGVAIQGGWGLGIPKTAQNKEAAFMVMTYLTGKQFATDLVQISDLSPFRASVYSDPALAQTLPSLPVAYQALQKASILQTSLIPQAFELATDAATAFYPALAGSSTAQKACAQAQSIWVQKLKSYGYLT